MLGELSAPAERHDDSKRSAFSYLFGVYLLCGMAEGLISPLFPLLRDDLHLEQAQQAALVAVLTAAIAAFNIVGGALAQRRLDDRALVRLSAGVLAMGMVASGAATSFAVLMVGQALVGVGFGLFFPSGLASVARLYEERRGRAIASYGLAYSVGLALAAASANAGRGGWRLVFFVSAGAAAGMAVFAPRWKAAPHDPERTSLVDQLRGYLQHRLYRLSATTSLAGLAMHYIVIGFSPTLFVDRGQSLSIVSLMIVIGRLGSVPGKIVFGTLFDRRGGLWATRAILGATAILGVPLLVAPSAIGLWLLPVFVALSASVFPIANALLVAALPPRSSWGIGTFRAVLLGASALLAALAGVLLHVVALPVVMAGALVIPAAVAVWIDSLERRESALSAVRSVRPRP